MAIIDLNTAKTLMGITGTEKDAMITLHIPVVEADFLRIRNKAFDVDESGNVVYPDNAVVVAAEMIRWRLESSPGYQSESLGDRSYQKESQFKGYPRSIADMIDQYMRVL